MFKYLYKYLHLNNVSHANIEEFKVQILSHPNYPSLLAISDTLSFLEINNGAFPVSFSELSELPTSFVALLKEDGEEKITPRLIRVDPDSDRYLVFDEGNSNKFKQVSKKILEQSWAGTVFMVEEQDATDSNGSGILKYLVPASILLSLVALLSFTQTGFFLNSFILLAIFGLYLTYNIISELYTDKQGALAKMCSISANTSCNQVLGSDKWKMFDYLNFSDLSLYLFSGQLFIGLLSILLNQQSNFVLLAFYGLLLIGIPTISLSIFYQKFIEKKWCPLCLLVSSTIVLQIVALFAEIRPGSGGTTFFTTENFTLFTISSVMISMCVILGWYFVKSLLVERKKLKSEYLKAGKTVKDYDLFKLALLNGERKEFPESSIRLGESGRKLTISFVTNPFCSFCEEVQKILGTAFRQYSDQLQIEYVVLGYSDQEEASASTYNSLISSFLRVGSEEFFNAYSAFLKKGAIENRISEDFSEKVSLGEIEKLLSLHTEWAYYNQVNFTPSVYINGYAFPRTYDYSNLRHFIHALVEDMEFEKSTEFTSLETA